MKADEMRVKDEMVIMTADHEVLVSFDEDDAAVAFEQWITSDEGLAAFNAWLQKNSEHFYNLCD